MKSSKGRKPSFERLKTGLEEGTRHAQGEITPEDHDPRNA
jgi:hypothetical protein